MVIGKPAPFVSAFVDAIDEAIRVHSPGQGLSALQRGLAGVLSHGHPGDQLHLLGAL